MTKRNPWKMLLATALIVIIAFTVAGCAKDSVIVRDRPVEVLVPVSQPCALPRPEPIAPIKERIDAREWQSRDVRQKAAEVARQALLRQQYGEQLDAATGACAEID